ncbi:MAG TPA: hypothetical protein VLR27_06935 [Acidimicrobiales bacterium]|nr:hypothetical protein [Acidimicrobiales bacterium]
MLDASASAAGALALALVLAGCGGDSAPEADAAAATDRSGEVRSPSPDIEEADGTGRSLDQLATAASGALSAERYEVTDGDGIRFIMGPGSSVDSTTGLCLGAATVLPDGTDITLVFPDGELRCD